MGASNGERRCQSGRVIPARLLLMAVLVALFAHAQYYFPFFSDDALITLRYSQRLCQGLGLTWTDGERVEGYTDLLWVLLNAPAACVGLDPMWNARVLDFAGCALAMLAAGCAPAAPLLAPTLPRVLGGSVVLAASAPVAVWAIGGLEHGFIVGVLALGTALGRRGPRANVVRECLQVGGCFGALVLLRADGVVLFVAATLGRFVTRDGRRGGVRALIAWVAIPIVLLLLQLVFRLSYYGEWVPNSAVAKVTFSKHRVLEGLEHVRTGYTPLVVWLGAVLLSLRICWRRVPALQLAVPLAVAILWPAYVVVVGGDIFPGWRQLLPGLVPLAFLTADGADEAARREVPFNTRMLAGAAFVSAFAVHLKLQFQDSENRRAKAELWEWDGLPLGRALHRAFAEKRPVLAVDAAGALPYWSELPALDMLGLNDHYIPRHPPPGFGRGVIGHELGDPDYVWQRSPDIIAFCGSVGDRTPCFYAGRALVRRPLFHMRYQLVRLASASGGRPGELYVKRDGKIGLERNQNRIDIPAQLLTQGPAMARVGAGGEISVRVDRRRIARIERVFVPAGKWSVTTLPQRADLQLGFACDGTSPARTEGSPRVIQLSVPAHVDIALAPRAGTLELSRLTLTRSTEAHARYECDERTATAVVTRSIKDLPTEPPASPDWAGSACIRFGARGMRVTFPEPRVVSHVSITADGNDRYAATLFQGERVVASFEVPYSGRELTTREIDVASQGTNDAHADSLLIVPTEGDGAYSVAALRLR